jgi:hypothetical protein
MFLSLKRVADQKAAPAAPAAPAKDAAKKN